MDVVTPRELHQLRELATDYHKCARLSSWEINFMNDIEDNLRALGSNIRMSDKMWDTFESISNKVYKT